MGEMAPRLDRPTQTTPPFVFSSRSSSSSSTNYQRSINTGARTSSINSHPVFGKIPGALTRCMRLPVVAPPPTGPLCLIPAMLEENIHNSYNITVDPRLCRGSVFAKRRENVEQRKQQVNTTKREAKYRLNVIRNRLENSLPAVGQPNQNGHVSYEAAHHKRNGSAKATKSSAADQHPMRRNIVRLPTVPIIQTASIDKQFRAVRNVKFAPIVAQQPKAVPVPVVLRIEEIARPSASRTTVTSQSVQDQTETPPPSPRLDYGYPIINTSVQTDDVFDVETSAIVSDIAETAIQKALASLDYELKIEALRLETDGIKKELRKERTVREKAEKTIIKNMEEKKKILQETAERERRTIASKLLAVETCRQVTESSMKHLDDLAFLNPKTKSIGLDTRPLNKMQKKVDLATIELEKDFFPWIFARAEQIYFRKLKAANAQYERKGPNIPQLRRILSRG